MARSNKILFRVVIGLLCATLLTTSAISTTFAKYASATERFSDSARVAIWGGTVGDSWDETEVKIKPGIQGELVRVQAKGESEVAYNVDLDIDFSIFSGYQKIDAGKDYFPLLITVGVGGYNVTTYEEHFYMGMNNSVDSVESLIAAIKARVDAGAFNKDIAPGAGSNEQPVEFYVKWRWFYDETEINSSTIPTAAKTALAAYQTPEKDTLLGEAMRIRAAFDAIIAKEGNDVKYETLKNLVEQYKDVTDPTEDQVTALSNAIADFFGEETITYTYKKTETYNIRWTGVRNSKYMTCYDPAGSITSYGDYFTLTSTDGYITSEAKSEANKAGLELFYRSIPERVNGEIVANGATIPLREGFRYEYYFKARNNRDLLASSQGIGSAGVVFAIDEDDVPYFLYGEFTNNSDLGINKGAQLGVRYGTWESALQNGTKESSEMVKTETIGGLVYGLYKIVYDGFNVTCYWMDTNGIYQPIGDSFDLEEGSRISVGVESREGYGSTERTVTVRDASFVQTKEVVSVDTVFSSLVTRAQSVITACENGPFDLSATLIVDLKQIIG